MGENADIKHYDLRPAGQSLTLFATSASKAAIVARLLEARWLTRASTLSAGGAATGQTLSGRRYDRPVTVRWDRRRRAPALFFWRRRRYVVDEVLAYWVSESYWWDPERRVSRSHWRLVSGGGIYELYFDRTSMRWHLATVVD